MNQTNGVTMGYTSCHLDPPSFVQHPSPGALPWIPDGMHTESDAVLMSSD